MQYVYRQVFKKIISLSHVCTYIYLRKILCGHAITYHFTPICATLNVAHVTDAQPVVVFFELSHKKHMDIKLIK